MSYIRVDGKSLQKRWQTHATHLSLEERLLEGSLVGDDVLVRKHAETFSPVSHNAEGPVRGILAKPEKGPNRVR